MEELKKLLNSNKKYINNKEKKNIKACIEENDNLNKAFNEIRKIAKRMFSFIVIVICCLLGAVIFCLFAFITIKGLQNDISLKQTYIKKLEDDLDIYDKAYTEVFNENESLKFKDMEE